MNMEILGTIIWILFLSLLVFVACRELICWYWKINATVKNLSEINEKLSIIISKMDKVEDNKNKEIETEEKKSDSKGTYA